MLTLSYRPISLSVAVICHSILCTLAPVASLCDNWSRVLGLMYAAFLLEPSLQVCVRVSERVDSFASNDNDDTEMFQACTVVLIYSTVH